MPKQTFEDLTWLEKVDLLRKFSIFPAITVMVFIRRRIGFRMLKPTWLWALTFVMLFVAFWPGPVAQPFRFLMILYAVSMLALGLYQRWQRWRELCGLVHWYTYSVGISYWESVRLPDALKSNPRVNRVLDPVIRFFNSHYRINRFLDPAAVGIVGVIIARFFSHGLGLWILFSAFFLYVFEQDVYERSVNQDLDTLDGIYISELQSKLLDAFRPKTPQEEQKQRSVDETSGIPTGLAPDLHMSVQIMQVEISQRQQAAEGRRPPPNPPPPGEVIIDVPN